MEATKSLVDRTLRTLKHGDLFGIFAKDGDCRGGEDGPDGLFFKDTRYLSNLELRIGGSPPLLLSSVVLDDNAALIVDQTNADLHDAGGDRWLARDSLFIGRTKFLRSTTAYERIVVRRFVPLPRPVPIEIIFAADFADLFEVRGEPRPLRGTMEATKIDERSVRFAYRGLDDVARSTTLYLDPAPTFLSAEMARWEVDFGNAERCTILMKADCTLGEEGAPEPPHLVTAYRLLLKANRNRPVRLDSVSTSNERFNAVLDRSASDLQMLLTDTATGLYPYAGVPWYSTIFGRDGIITAMMLLWIAPGIAKGVLQTLASTQAASTDEAADAEPGKILHEMRSGEMAQLGEVPFLRYYGTIDATPLFVMLAGMYLRQTGDLETVRAIWPNIVAALDWIDRHGDGDGDGFVEYHRMTEQGLANQGWKDSYDSIFHADGRLAEGPIALCEVQAYVFAAKVGAATMARAMDEPEHALRLEQQAEELRRKFEESFWDEALGSYVLALDGAKQPCRVLASNAGHALFGGIAAPDRAERVAKLLMSRSFYNGWGIRTLASGEARYNPMSYHNGSVWPHDNALIAIGLGRYGHKAAVARIFEGLTSAAFYDELHRLPELFCGFSRRPKRGPTSYPVACSPQAWAAAAPYALVAATTGLQIDFESDQIAVSEPMLPALLDSLHLKDVAMAGFTADLRFTRKGNGVATSIKRRARPAGLVRAR
ncbi:amylo-alpha-1,6-glucosidase [Sphingosinicella sp. CPCC 101087]|uniref:amylo-alpha-1,6-glucosidase n=1 Tax=Sphingosinicella sp. CPCC 101087 TaxID=2497754 RepID=UPI0013EAF467|nr:amylo-alpha-1,6-glucosidase [Sphingosinicella sp. CPCC 101087]